LSGLWARNPVRLACGRSHHPVGLWPGRPRTWTILASQPWTPAGHPIQHNTGRLDRYRVANSV